MQARRREREEQKRAAAKANEIQETSKMQSKRCQIEFLYFMELKQKQALENSEKPPLLREARAIWICGGCVQFAEKYYLRVDKL